MLTFYGTGMILGAGIYSIIGQTAGIAGEGLWQGFLLAALAAMLTALSYAELASIFPRAGAEYIYLRNAFSGQRWIAATMGIMMTFAGCATATTVALAFASYLRFFVDLPNLWVALSLLLLFTGINIAGMRESSWVNAVFTVIEAAGLILFIWIGWQSPTFGDALSAAPTSATLSSAALIIFAYFGFENMVNLSEETHDPEKTVPRAIFLSLAISTVLYILVSLAAVALMPPEELALTESALTDAAKGSFPGFAGVLGGIALFSTANTALIALVTTSRIVYGISKDKSLPSFLSRTHSRRGTPWAAALVVLIVSSLLLPLGTVKTVASISAFATMTAFIAVNGALISLRIREPHRARPFRVPLSVRGLPLLPLLAIAACLIFLFQFEWRIYLVGLSAFAISAGIYRFGNFNRHED